jgi:flavin reductase (DIM6/NTAB) family NADH-FMN oxidoreductase RutF
MSKLTWKPGTMVYPVPAVMVSCGKSQELYNIITIAWTGTICTDPALAYISIRRSRYSYDLIKDAGGFVINLTTKSLVKATDYCGVVSGRDVNKFEKMNLTAIPATHVKAPMIDQSPINIECSLKDIIELGTHDMFIGEVKAVHADEKYLDETGRFRLDLAQPIAYSHGSYYTLGDKLGTFGYSVKKHKKVKSKK